MSKTVDDSRSRYEIKQYLKKKKINDLRVGKYFLNRTYKALTLKENMDKLDYFKIK